MSLSVYTQELPSRLSLCSGFLSCCLMLVVGAGIVRQSAPSPAAPTDPAAPAPTKKKRNKKEWAYANALFAGPDSAWYDFLEGNNVVKMAKKEFKDLDAFCEWRQEKKRTGLPTNIIEVRKEYERFKTPALDLTAMAPAKAPPAPIYRKINLGEL